MVIFKTDDASFFKSPSSNEQWLTKNEWGKILLITKSFLKAPKIVKQERCPMTQEYGFVKNET